jgi:cytochrome P450
VLNRPLIIISDTKIIQDVLSNQVYEFTKPFSELADLVKVLGKGLVLVEGETHKRQRRMMNPAFSHNNIKVYIKNYNL